MSVTDHMKPEFRRISRPSVILLHVISEKGVNWSYGDEGSTCSSAINEIPSCYFVQYFSTSYILHFKGFKNYTIYED
jgi:hypothetical protein